MVALVIDREQLRKDGKTAGSYLTLFSFVIVFFGALLEVLGIIDVVPPIGDKVIAGLMLLFYVYSWKDELQMIAAKLRRLPATVYRRYTVEENAGTLNMDD